MARKKYDEVEDEVEEAVYEEDTESEEEDDEISPEEEGFMKGYAEDGKMAKCAKCGGALRDMDDVVEREINDEVYRFCSDRCAEKFKLKKR